MGRTRLAGRNRVRPSRVATDPVVAGDAPCVVTGCGKPRTAIARMHGDPFCSRPCCELWYLGESRAHDLAPGRAA